MLYTFGLTILGLFGILLHYAWLLKANPRYSDAFRSLLELLKSSTLEFRNDVPFVGIVCIFFCLMIYSSFWDPVRIKGGTTSNLLGVFANSIVSLVVIGNIESFIACLTHEKTERYNANAHQASL